MKKINKLRIACSQSANSAVLMLVTIACAVQVIVGCSGGETLGISSDIPSKDTTKVIVDHYYSSERVLVSNANVKDSLAKSVATFKLVSTMKGSDDDTEYSYSFSPSAYLNVKLAKERIEISSEDDLPVFLTKQTIKSRTPYRNGITLGEDAVKVFDYSDGQQATVSYGYRYTGVIQNGDTLATPHLAIEPVEYFSYEYQRSGEQTETENPYKMTLAFDATYTAKGTSQTNAADVVRLQPWYQKVVTSEARKVLKVAYSGEYVGCPYTGYKLTETVTTNKGIVTNTYSTNLSINITAPVQREQPSADSLFATKSTGTLSEKTFAETKTEEGFTVKTMTGTYVSSVSGKKSGTKVESTVNFTYQKPVKFESEYGSYTIPDISLKFTEAGFSVTKQSETDDYKMYKSVNSVFGELANCTMDVIDEVVNLKIQKDKPNVTKTDSTYTLKGDDDSYVVDKTIIWSDGTKTTSTYTYDGRHSAAATDFGEVITSSLDWSEGALSRVSTSQTTETKTFSNVTKFTATYTTSKWQSAATNGKEKGTFAFTETSPKVVFTDGKTTKTFSERKYAMTGMGATVASSYTTVVRDGVSYKAYDYDYTVKAVWNGGTGTSLVSAGTLLITADVVGKTTYKAEQSWNGMTTTVKVTKTTPHSAMDDEVQTYTKQFTVSLGELSYAKVYADNTSFSTRETKSESNSSATDGYWTVKTYETTHTYTTSNGTVKREQNLKSKGAEIVFNDGTFSHTFDAKLTLSKSESFGTARTDGDYTVTPHKLTVKATTQNGGSISTTGTTDIYVKAAEPEKPHFGKPKSFTATAVFDPSAKVTRRAFVFRWESGVTYAVCDYETELPASADFKHKEDTYSGYNSAAYSSGNWLPARGVEASDGLEWYSGNGSLISAISDAECMILGWKNIVSGQYALEIQGYTYTMNGYNVTVTAPSGKSVTFNSHYTK